MDLRNLRATDDVYLQCPWCSYSDVPSEFGTYCHPDETMRDTLSTQCSQCHAAGATALFVLAYNSAAEVENRDVYLMFLDDIPD